MVTAVEFEVRGEELTNGIDTGAKQILAIYNTFPDKCLYVYTLVYVYACVCVRLRGRERFFFYVYECVRQ